jgi:hypothetical protein
VKRLTIACVIALAATPLVAQPHETAEHRVFRSEVELQLYNFGNFFQARQGLPEESINGYGAEYRAAYRTAPDAPDFYGSLNLLRYGGAASETSYGGRVGVSKYGNVHSYNVYLARQENGYAFEVGDETAAANITTLGGSYSYRVTRKWQAGVDTYFDRQRFDLHTGFENDYKSIGFQVRYRGFGNVLQPRIGYVTGQRDVETASQSYDESYWYIQLTTVPIPQLSASIRYRDRTRDYQNVDRTDDREQWLLRGTWRQNDRLGWTASYGQESTHSSRPGNDFDTDVGFVGVIIGF